MEMLRRSPDYLRKKLYYFEFNKKKKKKDSYLFSYFSPNKAETLYDWGRQALNYNARLLALPSAYKILHTWALQGPQIYLTISPILTLIFVQNFVSINGITCFVNKRWYAFFLFLELLQYSLLQNLCEDIKKITSKKLLLIKKLQKF